MNITDPIADMLTRIRNASRSKHKRDITLAVKRARQIAVLPFTQE